MELAPPVDAVAQDIVESVEVLDNEGVGARTMRWLQERAVKKCCSTPGSKSVVGRTRASPSSSALTKNGEKRRHSFRVEEESDEGGEEAVGREKKKTRGEGLTISRCKPSPLVHQILLPPPILTNSSCRSGGDKRWRSLVGRHGWCCRAREGELRRRRGIGLDARGEEERDDGDGLGERCCFCVDAVFGVVEDVGGAGVGETIGGVQGSRVAEVFEGVRGEVIAEGRVGGGERSLERCHRCDIVTGDAPAETPNTSWNASRQIDVSTKAAWPLSSVVGRGLSEVEGVVGGRQKGVR
ncbi:hypothetical protein R3P38DRAFT_2798727 [Favolaschia claudopus]|uniref:Uncharacterized protein n=1 Tax=Favolaschia claudopus TaxID=2862362 RepID=A0AAV9Z4S0_9AGAR